MRLQPHSMAELQDCNVHCGDLVWSRKTIFDAATYSHFAIFNKKNLICCCCCCLSVIRVARHNDCAMVAFGDITKMKFWSSGRLGPMVHVVNIGCWSLRRITDANGAHRARRLDLGALSGLSRRSIFLGDWHVSRYCVRMQDLYRTMHWLY